ncbi:MAG TPA: TonB-dependent receptor [Puia sp.]
MKPIITAFLFIVSCGHCYAQTQSVHGKIFDAVTREAIEGASILIRGTQQGTMTGASGEFNITAPAGAELIITATGHRSQTIRAIPAQLAVGLKPSDNRLQDVVVSGNRTIQKRTELPVAIATIGKQAIQDTKAQRLDYLLNQVSGVNMINLGNEQHMMAIRQPISTNNLFLYLEDGIPIRTSAVFNHNALIEMNLSAARSIEVIKGPASSLYGAEAIGGVVNLITQAPPAYTDGTFSVQSNNQGYRRVDAQIGTTVGKLGFIASGYYANQTNGPIQYSDFHKSASTYRLDYHIDKNTSWSNSVSYVDYFSDMYGSLDSSHFATKNYSAQSFFTYRKVFAFRGKSVLTHSWNENSTTTATFMFRSNSVIQNPSYQIGSYRSGNNPGNPISADTAIGNINDNSFRSYGLYLQHVQKFRFLESKLILGMNAEFNPQAYNQQFIWVRKQPNQLGLVNYVGYSPTDSVLANYKTLVTDFGSYADYEFSPVKGLRVSAAIRYDAFQYGFVNYLPGTKVTGGPSTVTNYSKVAPKIGATYNYKGIGFYANYSEGYVPPQITDVFGKTSNNTYLRPQTFRSYEVGGWLSLIGSRLYADWSAYLMNGTNEIINVRLPNGISQSENAGETRHRGIEYGLTYRPTDEWLIRFSGSSAKHSYVHYISAGVDYSGKEMAQAPHFFGNAQVTYKPRYLKGFYISLEGQRVGKYFMDNLQQYTYKGYQVVNFRAGYNYSQFGIWVNALNAFNEYYSTNSQASVSSGKASYTYQLGDPRAITLGLSYHFGK